LCETHFGHAVAVTALIRAGELWRAAGINHPAIKAFQFRPTM
jgi:hypothetical protein